MRGDLLDVIQEIENNFMEPEKLYILNICLGIGLVEVAVGNTKMRCKKCANRIIGLTTVAF